MRIPWTSTSQDRAAFFVGLVALLGVSCLGFDFSKGRFACDGKPCPAATCTCEAPSPRCATDTTLITAYPLGCDVAGVCKHQQLLTTCANGCLGNECVGEPCAGIVCNTPPPNTCTSSSNLASFTPTGTCTAGLCSYAPTAVPCIQGCKSGLCFGEPCKGVTCAKPPPPECVSANTLRIHSATGTCTAGRCAYTPADIPCSGGCADGACQEDLCQGVSCDAPPSNTCADPSTLSVNRALGSCTAGVCSYSTTSVMCMGGCASGACVGDPCAGVTCSTPPAASCTGNTHQSYGSTGTCDEAAGCTYPTLSMTCPNGCDNGRCAAPPCGAMHCTSPPPASCPSNNMKKTYAGTGMCSPVSPSGCTYTPFFTPCGAGETCDGGTCLWTDASLASLTTSVSNLPYVAVETLYTVMVPVDSGSVTLTATLLDSSRQTLKANDAGVPSGIASLSVAPGGTSSFSVTPQNGPSRTYTVKVVEGWSQQAYVKASNTGPEDRFGSSVAMSASGNILAIGAPLEDGITNGTTSSGAVYVYSRSGSQWVKQAYLTSPTNAAGALFGTSVALSENGNDLVVGAPGDSSTASSSGAAYLYRRSSPPSDSWGNPQYFSASNAASGHRFGESVALAGGGDWLAVGAPGESSGIGTTVMDENALPKSGAVYLFNKGLGFSWGQATKIKAWYAKAYDAFGHSVALSRDGAYLAVGAPGDDSSAADSGAVYVIERNGSVLISSAYLKPSNTDAGYRFGESVALSASGTTLAVGAPGEAAATTGINGPQGNFTSANRGAAYVFTRAVTFWSQQAYVKPSSTRTDFYFATSVALSEDGNVLAVGGPGEPGAADGINGSQSSATKPRSGAAYAYLRNNSTWTQHAFIKASNPDMGDEFGHRVALSADGGTLAVTAVGEASGAVFTNAPDGGQNNNGFQNAGAAYVFTR